jgi:transposase
MKDHFLIFIFCLIDDFCKDFDPIWKRRLLSITPSGGNIRNKRSPNLSTSEIMTIVIYFHFSKMRTFKDFYTEFVLHRPRKWFPKAPSYNRFVRLMKRVLCPLFVFLQGIFGKCSGTSFIDSTILTVCHVRRISSHRVFRRMAKRGKTSTGWFFGFKLHLVINERGEILAFKLTSGNVDDRKPVLDLTKDLWGKCVGDIRISV